MKWLDLMVFVNLWVDPKSLTSYMQMICCCLVTLRWQRLEFLSIAFIYSQWSGQEANCHKSTVFISHITHTASARAIRDGFVFKPMMGSTHHLSLPLLMTKLKTAAFSEFQQRIENKILGWKRKLLSQAGRTILIRARASAIPIYGMSSYLLPHATCNSIDFMWPRFGWGL